MSDDTRDAAFTLLRLGRPEEALETLASGFDVDDPWSWQARALALLQLERYREAADAAQQGLAIDAENVALLDALAGARVGLEDFGGAEDAILEALYLDAEDPDLLARYANVVARVGQTEKAEKLLARALAIDPEHGYALQLHAIVAAARGDRRKMKERSRELLRVMPESAVGHRVLGAAHAEDGRAAEAHDHFARAVQIDPSDHEFAELAREARRETHWLLWPLRPIHRFGPAPIWIGAIVVMLTLRALKLDTAALVVTLVWVAYCVYSWIVPSIVRRLVR